MEKIADIAEIIQFIDAETLILTPNQRLATYLKYICEKAFKRANNAWPTPDIISISSWLNRLYQDFIPEGHHCPQLLTSVQERHLWQKVITEQDILFISNQHSVASQVQQAWEFMHLWQIDKNAVAQYTQEDYQWFISIFQRFQDLITANRYITSAELANYLIEHTQWISYFSPSKIVLFGFDEFNPAYEELLDRLTESGIKSTTLDIKVNNKHQQAYAFDDTEHEIKAMAHWAHQQYQQGRHNIACVVPNLLQNRNQIQRIFYETFFKNHFYYAQKQQSVFSMTGGVPLVETPIIETALSVLKSIRYKIDFSIVQKIMLSPFLLGAIEEADHRALALEKFRENSLLQIKLQQLIRFLERENTTPILLSVLQQIQSIPKQTKQGVHSWIQIITKLFTNIGWPGPRVISSIEYQQVSKFKEVLIEFSALNSLEEKISFQHFLSLLTENLRQQLFQAKNDITPVQVLGLLEAAGQQFDAIWLMGLTDECWPENPKPNPFLPAQIQRAYSLPHSSAEKELEFSTKMQDRLTNSCEEIIYSWPQTNNESQCSPSQLIAPYINQAKYSLPQTKMNDFLAHHKISIPLATNISIQEAVFSADSSLIKKQVECPFQAFAHYRLKAKAPEKIAFLTSKKVRGILLHHILQEFWLKHQELASVRELNLLEAVKEHTIACVTAFYKKANIDNHDFIQLEIYRIQKLLFDWLSLELERNDFSIYEIEKSHTLFIDKLKLRLRVDRVDQLHDGKLVIIDYKTGLTSEKKWLDLQFTEPQLPIYCLIFPEQVVALAFAQLNPENMKFKGITVETARLPGLEKQKDFTRNLNIFIETVSNVHNAVHNSKTLTLSEMFELQQAWETRVKQIAHDFTEGNTVVSPINEQVCLYCERQSLCRINDSKRTME